MQALSDTSYLDCGICQGIYKDPQSTQCGHSYCKGCITEWLTRKNTCPYCRTPVTDTFPNFLARQLVEALANKTDAIAEPALDSHSNAPSQVEQSVEERLAQLRIAPRVQQPQPIVEEPRNHWNVQVVEALWCTNARLTSSALSLAKYSQCDFLIINGVHIQELQNLIAAFEKTPPRAFKANKVIIILDNKGLAGELVSMDTIKKIMSLQKLFRNDAGAIEKDHFIYSRFNGYDIIQATMDQTESLPAEIDSKIRSLRPNIEK